MSAPDSGTGAQVSEPGRAWAGPSGLRIERLAGTGEPRHGAATVAVEPSPAGEPLWFTLDQWRDLCAACAQLGPGYAPEPAAHAAAEAAATAGPAS